MEAGWDKPNGSIYERSRLARVDGWISDLASPELWIPAARSSLAQDDNLTDPYHISRRAVISLTVAVDFVNALRGTLLGKPSRLHPFAQYGLVRGALENAATAVWLLDTKGRLARISNRLVLETSDTDYGWRIAKFCEVELPWTPDDRKERIAQKLIDAGWRPEPGGKAPSPLEAAKKSLMNGPGCGAIVKGAGEAACLGADIAFNAWAVCSGFAHGDMNKVVGLSNRKVAAPLSVGINLHSVAVDLPLLSSATRVAERMVETGFVLYRRRASAPQVS